MAIDFALSFLMECCSALAAGFLQDNAGMSAAGVSRLEFALGSLWVGCWVVFHSCGYGVPKSSPLKGSGSSEETALLATD